MVDFKKFIESGKIKPSIDPIAIFDNLDKQSGREFLRKTQEEILKDWHNKYRNSKDIIVKLHTGQGKTLIGLLMLQSYLNDGTGPALYICPNNYLVKQTTEQASAFGIKALPVEDSELPQEFLNSKAILVANCSKLFNGKSVFGVQGSGRDTIPIGALVIDDAHKCLDIIRQNFSITIRRINGDRSTSELYDNLLSIFEKSLETQGAGTLQDIKGGDPGLLSVPYWTWYEKKDEVLKLLYENKDKAEIFYSWDLIKDQIENCLCVFSGDSVEISPRLIPINRISSFEDAKHRIFLSATLNEDSFLVRDLGLDPSSVTNPLMLGDVKYSGERLILIPSLVDININREDIISWITDLAKRNGDLGTVTILPSYSLSKDWKNKGAEVAVGANLNDSITNFKNKINKKSSINPLVLVNQYDGIDLPDGTCRILCLDSLPSYDTLFERYMNQVRPNSNSVRRRLAQRVEQGMGRAIRGSSDWSVVIVTGIFLTRFLSDNSKRSFLSNEAQMQLRIGDELREMLKSEGGTLAVMEKLVQQCLERDEGWKQYYKQKMETIQADLHKKEYLDVAITEREAELLFQQGKIDRSVKTIRELIDNSSTIDKAWYLQLVGTYLYKVNKVSAMEAQSAAHAENLQLFLPEVGINYSKLISKSSRSSTIIEWIKTFESPQALLIDLQATLDDLSFNSSSERFEEGIMKLGIALGFASQRPEKETGTGPDNLWYTQDGEYWIIECKNQVSSERQRISKKEVGQLAVSSAWFVDKYSSSQGIPLIIHPARVLDDDAFFDKPAWVLDQNGLEKLRANLRDFYQSLANEKQTNLNERLIQEKFSRFSIETSNLMQNYLQRLIRPS